MKTQLVLFSIMIFSIILLAPLFIPVYAQVSNPKLDLDPFNSISVYCLKRPNVEQTDTEISVDFGSLNRFAECFENNQHDWQAYILDIDNIIIHSTEITSTSSTADRHSISFDGLEPGTLYNAVLLLTGSFDKFGESPYTAGTTVKRVAPFTTSERIDPSAPNIKSEFSTYFDTRYTINEDNTIDNFDILNKFEDVNGDIISLNDIYSSYTWIELDNDKLIFTPANQHVGNHNIPIEVSDGVITIYETLLIAVAPLVVNDVTDPIITVTDASYTIELGGSLTDFAYTASDNIDGNITSSVAVAGYPADTNTAGTYTVTFDVTDAAGNPAVQVTRTVNVVEPVTYVEEINERLLAIGTSPTPAESSYIEVL